MDGRREAAAEKRPDLDFAGFAQEFLRRNPDYVRNYRALGSAPPDDQEVMARRWGLCFPVPVRRIADGCAGVVARHAVSGHRHSRCGPTRVC